ncbi:MAG: serine/threonine-protein kinase [Byssovorax sp.]
MDEEHPTLHDGPRNVVARAKLGHRHGELVGRYLLLEELGRGGMGIVFAAWDTDLGRRIALKLLLSPNADEARRVRLRREAQAMARLSHPNVVTVHDVGTHESGTFIAMELIDGSTLGAWLKSKRTAPEVLRVLIAAGRGLAAAHAAGLVHRDFKPGNVLIARDGRVVVTDFGVARSDGSGPTTSASNPAHHDASATPTTPRGPSAGSPEGVPSPSPSGSGRRGRSPATGADATLDERVTLDDAVTEDGEIIGTVGYMAPEQMKTQRADPRSDQFAFCVALYRALYGQMPFTADSILEYWGALEEEPAPPPDGAAPAWIWPLLKRGMSLRPEDRHPSMDALLDGLANDPSRARVRRLLAIAALGLVALAVAVYATKARADRRACVAEGETVSTIWSAAARDEVKLALAAAQQRIGGRMPADAPDRAVAALDKFTASWRSTREQLCLEGLERGADASALTAPRTACLDNGREELAALVRELSVASDETGLGALRASIALQRPETCRSPPAGERPLPRDPAARESALELRRAMSRSLALRLLGRPGEALTDVRRAVAIARLAADPRAEAAALVQQSRLDALIGDPQAAIDDAMAAIAAAERGGDDALAARGAAYISNQLTDKMSRPRDAERWLAIAEAKLARVARDRDLEIDVLSSRALWLGSSTRLEESLPIYDRLSVLIEQLWGPVAEQGLTVLNNKALALASLGRYEEALALHRRAVAIGEDLFGPNELDLAVDHQNMAIVLIALSRFAEAEQEAQRSFDLRSVLGPTSPRLCWPLSVQAGIAVYLNRPDRALELADRCLALAKPRPDAVSGIMGSLLMHRGEALLMSGRFAEAAVDCRASLSLLEPLSPAEASDEPLTCLGRATIALGHLDEGIGHLERAATLIKREDPGSLALTRFALARALTSAGREPERARKLAEQARDALLSFPAHAARTEEIAQWLKAPSGLPAGPPAPH